MAAQTSNENLDQTSSGEDYVRRRLDAIEDTLTDGMRSDERLRNGVPEDHRANDLDFIRMTGLTRPLAGPKNLDPAPHADPSTLQPLSFYEKGIADVDHTMAPAGFEAEGQEPPDAIPARTVPSKSVDDLKRLIADLSDAGGAPQAVPDPTAELEDTTAPVATGEPLEQDEAGPPPAPPTPQAQPVEAGDESEETADEEPPEATRSEQETVDELDFDALIEQDGPPRVEAAPPPAAAASETPTLPERAEEPTDEALRLGEAEQLLQELELQPREPQPEVAPPKPFSASALFSETPPVDKGEQEEEPRLEYDYSAAPVQRRSRHHSRRRRRLIRRIGLVVAAVGIAAAAGFGFRHLVHPTILAPEESLAQAEALLERGDYREASLAFEAFARRNPHHRDRAEAQFKAAWAMQLVPASSHDAARAVYQAALDKFQTFVTENPGHPRRARAECLMGVLNYRLDNYAGAIALLRVPSRQVDDPDAALPALRTLAQAYAKSRDYENAESTYLQAAVLPKNYTPEEDYEALGYLFRKRAEATDSPTEKRHLAQTAVDYWTKATCVPGITPPKRENINSQITWLLTEMAELPANEAMSPAQAETAPSEEKPSSVAQPATAGNAPPEWELNPAEEAQYPQETAGAGT